jgi:hypothetical protein
MTYNALNNSHIKKKKIKESHLNDQDIINLLQQ